ncbi:MAG: type II toxin-antitoxin system PemK/MazF family toxin [Candidatus Nanopelagicales bacterium]
MGRLQVARASDRALSQGAVIWVNLSPTKGREQQGHRPAVVLSSSDHLSIVEDLVIVLPCTTTSRGWPNHVRVTGPTGLEGETFAMTEQPRTISRNRISEVTGVVDAGCLEQLQMWVADWLRPG